MIKRWLKLKVKCTFVFSKAQKGHYVCFKWTQHSNCILKKHSLVLFMICIFTALSCGMAILWLRVIDLYPVHPIPIKISAASSHLFMSCIEFVCNKQINMHRVFRLEFVHWKRCIVLELTTVLDLSILYIRKK